jgi:hypothetical protein
MKASGIGRVLWLGLALGLTGVVGCGGDEDTTGPFLGEWQFTSGTVNTQCPMIGFNQTDQLAGDKWRISKGIDSPLAFSDPDTNCVWKLTVNGMVANVMSGQSCTFTTSGSSVTAMYTAGTITVSGTTAQFSGTLTSMSNVQGSIVNCTTTGSGGLSKVAQ